MKLNEDIVRYAYFHHAYIVFVNILYSQQYIHIKRDNFRPCCSSSNKFEWKVSFSDLQCYIRNTLQLDIYMFQYWTETQAWNNIVIKTLIIEVSFKLRAQTLPQINIGWWKNKLDASVVFQDISIHCDTCNADTSVRST